MLSRNKVIDALQAKRTNFEAYQAGQRSEFDRRRQLLERFLQMTAAEVNARVAERGQEWPGALPTPELDQAVNLRLPFEQRWQSHQEARAWALTILANKPVLAVDGSQIPPSKEISAPVGAVQVGWYINYHAPGGRYEKDVTFTVLAPDELGDEEGGEFPDWRVNQQRFVGECTQLAALMQRFAAAGERPLCFFDGSFIISFAGQIRPARAEPYLKAVRALLEQARTLAMPLVGFVDSSGSHDVVMLVNTVAGPPNMGLTDGALLAPLLPNWGDRTPFFICARNDPLSQQGQAGFYQEVAFCYIRLAAERPPARIELPRWLVESGEAAAIVDRVRAECVIGAGGYPYAIETADAVAVLQPRDREHFYALFQQFAEQQGIPFHVSRKQLSKQMRR